MTHNVHQFVMQESFRDILKPEIAKTIEWSSCAFPSFSFSKAKLFYASASYTSTHNRHSNSLDVVDVIYDSIYISCTFSNTKSKMAILNGRVQTKVMVAHFSVFETWVKICIQIKQVIGSCLRGGSVRNRPTISAKFVGNFLAKRGFHKLTSACN